MNKKTRFEGWDPDGYEEAPPEMDEALERAVPLENPSESRGIDLSPEALRNTPIRVVREEVDASGVPQEVIVEEYRRREIRPGVFDKIPIEPKKTKQQITLRLDQEIVQHFKGLGKGYQTLINQVLKAYVQHQASVTKLS